jgi:hypothetical protein
MKLRYLLVYLSLLVVTACEFGAVNSPYPDQNPEIDTLYTSFSLRPKHLDPARSYSANEIAITGQIYEPPYQYHYLKRPYQLEPLVAADMPAVTYLDENDQPVPEDSDDVAYSVYIIPLKSGIFFQPHPAFVRDENGEFLYHNLSNEQLEEIEKLADFEQSDTVFCPHSVGGRAVLCPARTD